MVAPFLTPATAERIKTLRTRGFATRAVLADPPVDLVLERWDNVIQDWVSVPPQRVLLTYATREARQGEGETGTSTTADGALEKRTPFDVAVGDEFTLDGMRGRVVAVPFAQHGIQRADFEISVARGVA